MANVVFSIEGEIEGEAVGELTVRALRAVLVGVLASTVFAQAALVWALFTDPEDGSGGHGRRGRQALGFMPLAGLISP